MVKSSSSLGRSLIKQSHKRPTKQRATATPLATKSVTQPSDLEDFLAKATLAGREFEAEKAQSYRLCPNMNQSAVSAQQLVIPEHIRSTYQELLRIPRRPAWRKDMSAEQLDKAENEAFLAWRGQLAQLESVDGLRLTPFEKNLDFWRQLWRVVDRSDVLLLIVDARNPLLFYCEDLVRYVRQVGDGKLCLLLLNKTDLINAEQQQLWNEYFQRRHIEVLWFSALAANGVAEAMEQNSDGDGDDYDAQPNVVDAGDATLTVQRNVFEPLAADAVAIVTEEHSDEVIDENVAKQHVVVTADGSHELECEADDDSAEFSSTDSETASNVTDNDVTANPNANQSHRTSIVVDQSAAAMLSTADLIGHLESLREKIGKQHMTVGLCGFPNVGKSSVVNALVNAKKTSVSRTPGKTKHFQTLQLNDELELCDCPGLVFPSICSTAEMFLNGILCVHELRDSLAPVALICQRLPKATLERLYGVSLSDHFGDAELLTKYAANRGFRTASGLPDVSRAARYIVQDYLCGRLLYVHLPPGCQSRTELQSVQALAVDTRRGDQFDSRYFGTGNANAARIKSVNCSARKQDAAEERVGSKKHFNRNKRQKMRRIVDSSADNELF